VSEARRSELWNSCECFLPTSAEILGTGLSAGGGSLPGGRGDCRDTAPDGCGTDSGAEGGSKDGESGPSGGGSVADGSEGGGMCAAEGGVVCIAGGSEAGAGSRWGQRCAGRSSSGTQPGFSRRPRGGGSGASADDARREPGSPMRDWQHLGAIAAKSDGSPPLAAGIDAYHTDEATFQARRRRWCWCSLPPHHPPRTILLRAV